MRGQTEPGQLFEYRVLRSVWEPEKNAYNTEVVAKGELIAHGHSEAQMKVLLDVVVPVMQEKKFKAEEVDIKVRPF